MIRREDGFTLAEAVVVLAVAAILMGVLAGGSNYWIEVQRDMNLESVNEQVDQALITYYTVYGRFPFGILKNADGSDAVPVGSADTELSSTHAKELMQELERVTSQRGVKDFSSSDYKLSVTYKNAYVADIRVERGDGA